MDKLRLGRIDFLNVLPVYYPLEAGLVPNPFEIIPGVPSWLNGLAAGGKLDVSPVSSIEYARRAELYHLVPDISINSEGQVMSVLLLSRTPVEELSGKTVLASFQSHTTIGLFKVLCRMRYGITPVLQSGRCSEYISSHELPDACIAIGDEALRLGRSGLFPYVLDFGQAWYEWTGLPFVFAVWVIRRETVAEKNAQVQRGVEALLSSKRWGRENIGTICEQAAKAGVLEVQALDEYYRCLQYDLNEKERKGLALFYSYLSQVGEIERAPALDVYTPLASVA